ncbi:hypothetical protein WS90_36525 [Burkholderia cepacia]|uniref:Uncharacterized protein n=1 Tax=Burkholderia cepacia TaxID=292 RepID=A0A104A0B7_BURCE|nr:hypothetical protein [Burkholderia cepacia]KVK89304.1 hypothetical protein WS90_36525 [Burkholderia cepacia]
MGTTRAAWPVAFGANAMIEGVGRVQRGAKNAAPASGGAGTERFAPHRWAGSNEPAARPGIVASGRAT